jgi:hypothetical protein
MEQAGKDGKKTGKGLRKFWIPLAAAAVIIAVVVGFAWHSIFRSSPLPSWITAQSVGFAPYFFTGRIPAYYKIDTAHITYSQGLLFIPLTKPGQPTITITEQGMPQTLSISDIQQNSEAVDVAGGSASINTIEGRLVGTFINADHKTLVVLSSTDSEINKDDLRLLLQGLQVVH